MGIALFIIFALIMVISMVLAILKTKDVINNTVTKIDFKGYFKINSIYMSVFTLSLMAMFLSIYPWAGISPNGGEIVQTIFGSIGFGITGFISLHSFLLHYYAKEIPEQGKNIPENIDKKLFISLMVSFPIMFLFIFLLSNGFADYMNMNSPLVNGFNFSHGWVNPYTGKTNIAFYALCILSGAVYVYFYVDHKFYIEYGKHGILESTFLIAFPAGIIGARVFYVLGMWDEFNGDFGKMINMTEGGLTILGGAITGIVVGVAWFMWRKRQYNIWVAIDIIVPAILIAQAVGRWGNFFNCEVHGVAVDGSSYQWWLPKIIYNNMRFSDTGGTLPFGQIYVPLFLIEGITNFLGFFILAHVFGKALRKYTELGDLGFGYIIWYGLTRVILEPIRYSSYKMNFWSWFWSFAFVFVGVLCIVINHIVRYIFRKKKNELHVKKNWTNIGLISSSSIIVISLALIVPGLIMMINNPFLKTEPEFNPFNIGLTLMVLGVSTLLCLGISLIYVFEGKKYTNEQI